MTILRRGQPIPDDDMVAVLVGTLETRLSVATTEGTVKIAIDWPDARTAFQLVDAAQRNFLEARHLSEVSTISEAISILESRATTLREEIEVDLEKVEAARKDLERRRPKAPAPVAAPVRTVKHEDDSLAELREQVETKRRAIADLEDFHKRQLKQLQTRLAEAKAVYSDAHPLVLDLKQQIDTLQGQSESLQLSTLREELRVLEKEALRKGAITSTETGDTVRNARRLPVAPQQLARATSAEIEEAPIEQAKGDLRYALSKYNSILDRIDSARMEMETARAAFKYRYSVISPAEIPRDPVKPKVAPVMAVSAVAGLLLAIFLAGALDLRRGMVHESWQLVRHLDLPVVGEVRRA
jgi:chromosome segregation ATPase